MPEISTPTPRTISSPANAPKAAGSPAGYWAGGDPVPARDPRILRDALARIAEPFFVLQTAEGLAVGRGGEAVFPDGAASGGARIPQNAWPILAHAPACRLEALGDPSFAADLGIRYPCVAGAMANGVGSVEIVEAMARAGMIGFFGAAGLSIPEIETALDRLQRSLGDAPQPLSWGANLIHSPNEPEHEAATVALYLRRAVRVVSASAYLRLTLPLVRYRVHGLYRDPETGRVVAPNRVIGKVSRIEVARRFFSPPPEKFLRELVAAGDITAEQAEMAREIPVAQDLTAEADSGGHTDNQPFATLLPTLLALRDQMQSEFGCDQPLRVGAAGGIGTPSAAAAAFAMGAAYILTGSINQACVEAGTSDRVRAMLCQTQQADVAMAPAADMFEMGIKVQVLKRGTMFAMRAGKLFELYRAHQSLDEIPAPQLEKLEKEIFKAPVEEVWRQTRAFFAERDARQIERAERDPHHRMALVFRWYLGQSSNWANRGDADRQMDYQVWCGPAMGAFNEWARGTFLEAGAERRVDLVNLNLLYGAAVLTRAQNLRAQGVAVPAEAVRIEPLSMERLKDL